MDSGTFVEFPPKSAHVVASYLVRLLKSLPSPLLPQSIIDLMVKLDGVVDKPMRNLRVLTAICEAINTSSIRTRGIIAQFSRLLVEVSLRPSAKMPLPNLVACVGSCFFANTAEGQGEVATHKAATVIQECMVLLLQTVPVFFDYVISLAPSSHPLCALLHIPIHFLPSY
jgi:hypothetical protein